MAVKLQSGQIPQNSGVYFFRAKSGKILYIGKANNLRARLGSYFQKHHPSLKTAMLVDEAVTVDWEILNSETEALIKEAELIKKHRPKYNVLMRDDKNYFYAGFTEEKFPKIFITHQPESHKAYGVRHKSNHIGPFTEGGPLRTVLGTLRRTFPYCTCKILHDKLCLNGRIGRCPGFCCLKSQRSEYVWDYQKNIKAIKKILSGKNQNLALGLKKEMQRLSKNQKYEEAGKIRNKIWALEKIFEHRGVIKQDLPSESAKALRDLESIFGISSIQRIEAYDIANIGGRFAYGSMAVLENGAIKKDAYRIFKIKSVLGSNDPAMLREVLMRRFRHPEWPYPQVIIIDGGKPQLNAIRHTLYAVNSEHTAYGIRHTAVIALTKNKKHVGDHVLIQGKKSPIPLIQLPPPLKNLILLLDSEAHRFAVSFYRKQHRKSLLA